MSMPNRVRSDNTLPVGTTELQARNNVSGTTTKTLLGPYSVGKSNFREMSDYVTPGFETLRKRGQIINNSMKSWRGELNCPVAPFYADERVVRISDGAVITSQTSVMTNGMSHDHDYKSTFLFHKTQAQRDSFVATTSDPIPSAESSTLTAAYAKAAETDVLILVSAAEARKTLATVEDALSFYQSRLLPFLKGLSRAGNLRRHITPSGLFRTSSVAAQLWLEYRYGIMPMVYDFQSYVKLVSDRNKRRRVRFTAQKSGEVTLENSETTATGPFRVDKVQRKVTRRDTVSSGVLIEAGPITPSGILPQLGADRILSTAWELIPFSFVIDWFLNTSNWLSAHEGRFRFDSLATWSTRTTVFDGFYGHQATPRNYDTGGHRYQAMYTWSHSADESLTRVVRTANPSLRALPELQIKLNWKRCTDLAALALTASNLSKTLRL